jgi:excisionase family DNA binding protein
MFAVHPATVARWAEAGTLRGFKTPGGHWRFKRAEVEAFRDQGVTPDEPTAESGAV